ncbi:NUDIX domain-containing protein [Cryocola sp. 340MFSha3.1]|uniref:NUDIX hydrolase n=1 Tax=Cryocola sp. 340MFSha3.1 TaxID=1169145 RepID=UPI000688AC02|nr:NUDIX domain-containing protein [Cryocola sp. 340MFSha3.1]
MVTIPPSAGRRLGWPYAIPRFSVVPAAYVYLRRGDQVLLQRRQNTGYMDGMWVAGAAGHIELGETAANTAVHEAREELGIEISVGSLLAATVMQRTDGTSTPNEQRADWFFTATKWFGEPSVMESHKCAEVAWFPLLALPDSMPEYERFVLDCLASGELAPFTSFGF